MTHFTLQHKHKTKQRHYTQNNTNTSIRTSRFPVPHHPTCHSTTKDISPKATTQTTQHDHQNLTEHFPNTPVLCSPRLISLAVCNESLPSKPHMTIENSTYPGYETHWMKYNCYPGMGTADGEVEQLFTCTEYNGTYDYNGTEVKECNRCMIPPNEDITNSLTPDSDGPWMVNALVTVTCEDSYLVAHNKRDQEVLCTSTGWDSLECQRGCLGEPLVGNATTTWWDDMWRVGDNVIATCLEGYHFIEADTTEMSFSCQYDGWEDLPACEKVCQDDLEVANATAERNGRVWLVGRINTVTCFHEHRFLSINNAMMEVECTFDGWEETEGCLKVCEDEPTVTNASTDWISTEPWPEGSSVEVTCNTGLYQYPSLETQQTLHCNYEGWTNAICEQVCFVAPDLTQYKALWNDSIAPGRLNDEISINCRSSHYHNESLNDTTITTVCTPDGWLATNPCILSCRDPPDFGTVIMEWPEREPGRFGDEVILECPAKHRNNENVSLTTITVSCTSEGWKTITTCQQMCLEEDLGGVAIEEEEPGVWRVDEVVTRACPEDLLTFDKALNISDFICTADGWANPDPCVNVCRERLYPVNGHARWDQRIWTAGHELLVVCLSQHHVSPDVYSYTVPCTDSGWHSVNSSCSYCEYSCVLHAH
ncbi:complement factor H-like isoform X1 [Scylla paramamosain]|uniref:complement factor H-like isoform X1 n=1 Tax=Scylla paramamosain TaxID=85552 RepID=UPI003082FAB9